MKKLLLISLLITGFCHSQPRKILHKGAEVIQGTVSIVSDADKINETTGRTLTTDDLGQVIRYNSSSDGTFIIPTGLGNASTDDNIYAVTFVQIGAGKVQVQGASGVTFPQRRTNAAKAVMSVVATNTNVWEHWGTVNETYTISTPPSLASGSTFAATGAGNSISINHPATVNANDILMVQVYKDENVTFTTPTGWTQITITPSTAAGTAVFWKRAVGTEDGTSLTITNSASGGTVNFAAMHRFTGCTTSGTPFEASNVVNTQQMAGGAFNIPSITTTGTNRLVLSFLQVGDNRTITTDATNYTSSFSQKTSTGTDAWLLLYSQTAASAGAVSSDSVTFDQGEQGSIVTLALIPQ